MAEDNVGFWSYAHEDNRLDRDRLLLLAEHLADEYALLTGEHLEIFVDRETLQWGDVWRERIDGALVQTTFFIPVITPRYFTREECRRELLSFHREARRHGVDDLILPILYVEVADLGEDNPDEAISLISRRQYVDWRHLRLAGIDSVEYRRAVNALAQRLAEIAKEVTQRQLDSERRSSELEPRAAIGLLEVSEAVEGPIQEWLTLLLNDEVGYFLYDAADDVFTERMRRASTPGARFAVVRQHAEAQMPIAEKHVEYTRGLATMTAELDPHVTTALELIAADPTAWDAFPQLREALVEARRTLSENDARFNASGSFASQGFQRFAHVTRTMGVVSSLHERAERFADEVWFVVKRWFDLAGLEPIPEYRLAGPPQLDPLNLK